MGLPRNYALLLDDAHCDEISEHVHGMSEEEMSEGMSDEQARERAVGDIRHGAVSQGKTLARRLCWMTRAQRDAWLAREEYPAEEREVIRRIWIKILEDEASAGTLSAKLRGELAAEIATGIARDTSPMSGEAMAVAHYMVGVEEIIASTEKG